MAVALSRVQPGCASVPPHRRVFGVPRRVTSGRPVNPLLGAKVLPGETDIAPPARCRLILSRTYSSYWTKRPRRWGSLGPWLENACGISALQLCDNTLIIQ